MAISTQPAGTRLNPILMGQVLPDPIRNKVGYGFKKKSKVGLGFIKNPPRNSACTRTWTRPGYSEITKKPPIYIAIN